MLKAGKTLTRIETIKKWLPEVQPIILTHVGSNQVSILAHFQRKTRENLPQMEPVVGWKSAQNQLFITFQQHFSKFWNMRVCSFQGRRMCPSSTATEWMWSAVRRELWSVRARKSPTTSGAVCVSKETTSRRTWSSTKQNKVREAIIFGFHETFTQPLTASLFAIEMSILRVDKMRPLFQEAIVTKLAVTQSTTRYQMKAAYIIFQMIPNE